MKTWNALESIDGQTVRAYYRVWPKYTGLGGCCDVLERSFTLVLPVRTVVNLSEEPRDHFGRVRTCRVARVEVSANGGKTWHVACPDEVLTDGGRALDAATEVRS
jgi:hypothetical protein